ncbi:phosphatase [Photobacterium sp. NCIMB 13483]|uniref:Dual specificity phosphatase, catalytic domain n=1 Tax=Photobacterium piscicola TaxID=1378299 RepID=A0A1T5I0Z6_9GAMM|nr:MULTISPECIES: dual specificity protein phosphatase family protein [Photobacterium]PST85975.1 phosphatase [Photobacterium sp. NCIMB 13483]SKC32741.1 Dual specificity phosphatase, catalytic domain [Photobacterium piscicola]
MDNLHPVWSLPLNDTTPLKGGLLLTPCPGTKGVNAITSLRQLKAAGATVVLTALEENELSNQGVQLLAEACKLLGMQWFHVPIEDDCAPTADFEKKWQRANDAAQIALNNGEFVVAHCKGGSGRTGILAARLLLARGMPFNATLASIQAQRPGAFARQSHIDYIKQWNNDAKH